MKIGFDLSQTAFNGGVVTYTNNLAQRLSKVEDLEMVYFYSSLKTPYRGNLSNVKTYPFPPKVQEIMFNKLRFIPIEYFLGKIDIFHSSDWTQPKTRALKVTTYHDVIPLKYPEWSHPKIVAVHKRRLAIVEKEIDMIIAVSKSTKEDLIKISKIHEEKITVIYEAAGEEYKPLPSDQVENFRKKFQLPEKFILSLGGIGERKNLNRIKEAAGNFPLVITGENIPWVPQQELPLLYNSASLLLYPSLYEGFGLPVLEAMACGIPVITSDISSLPEVGGDAALYVNPKNVDQIKKVVNKVMGDKELYKETIKKGLKQASKFSWEKCAQETVDLYGKVLTGSVN